MAQVAAVVSKVVGGAAQMVGYQQAADSARVAGQRKNVESQFEAEQMEQQAGQTIAASQRTALDQRRQANLLASRALALAAASGGGASDPTVVRIIAGIKGEGAYRSAVSLYRGEEEARKLNLGAQGKRYEGATAEEAGLKQGASYDALATAALFDSAGSLAGKYG